jgi:endonuclease/exonuclease/phosphatase family metal-dependent hydrolase
MGKAIFTKGNANILDFNSNALNLEHSDRGYLRILFAYPNSNEKILLYNVHLSYGSPPSTKKEIVTLIAMIEQEMKEFNTNNVIIMGDFNNSPFEMENEKTKEKEEKKAIFSGLEKNKFTLLNDPTPTTFTQNHAGITIDLAWVSPGFLEKFEIKNDPGENGKGYKLAFPSDASDHWPIYIDFELKKKDDSLSKALSLLKAKLLQLAKTLKKK